jgi:hypothetical protein
LRAHEKQVAESYGWVDQGAGVVRIPVSEAMKLIAQRGLPVRDASPVPPPSPASSRSASEGERK